MVLGIRYLGTVSTVYGWYLAFQKISGGLQARIGLILKLQVAHSLERLSSSYYENDLLRVPWNCASKSWISMDVPFSAPLILPVIRVLCF
jgi:hypothetical protein